jgi:protein-S-isoprenylcysteine O-methyltransferase Ste14
VHFDVFHFDVFQWIDGLWITFIAIWLLGAMRVKRAARRISGRARMLQILLAIAGAVLLFDPSLGIGFLASRFLPENATVAYLGLAMTAGGLAFAVWARFILGQNWSGQITLKEGHELIVRGPYALVRHPIYSGILLGLLGTAFCVDQVRGSISSLSTRSESADPFCCLTVVQLLFDCLVNYGAAQTKFAASSVLPDPL